ncbi:MAG: hypothetical protein AABY46_07200 [Nitrospirota bacterium]
MLKSCGAVVVLTVLTLPVGVVAFAPPAEADEFIFAIGVKAHYATLTRTLKVDSDPHRVETPRSDAAWMQGVTFNAAYGHLFFGADYSSSAFIDSEGPLSSSGVPVFHKDVNLDISELDLAVGYTIVAGVSPYIGYLRHGQKSDLNCSGCTATVELGDIGPGLLLAYPVARTHWGAYVNMALIQGFSIEGGLSYAGIRWPVVGVAGFAYRRIDYPVEEVSCQTDFPCFRESDVISGPIVAVHYIF